MPSDDEIIRRAEKAGALVVRYRGELFVVIVVNSMITITDRRRRHYASGIWRHGYAHYENEKKLCWRTLDRIELALRKRLLRASKNCG